MHRLLSASFFFIVAVAASIPACATVRNVPKQYSTIQAAVDAAQPGDIVRINGGTYHESVLILNTFNIEIDGENGASMVGNMTPAQASFDIFSPGNSVHGLSVSNYDVGIALQASGRIYNNVISGCNIGLYTSVFGDGVNLPAPTSLDHNTVRSNGDGIFIDNCENVTAASNTVVMNGLNVGGVGITVQFSDTCRVTGNVVPMNGEGILAFFGTTGCTFSNNVSVANQGLDAEDDNDGANTWSNNVFDAGKTSGI
ncbi:MAG TPA: right-handed parallel beta-helix repeat-containing protein [Chthonomonadaceae bacterium]|nr:right-handed parallel beta-helix repeat-containing protein [Chthonomonadaceae bacterium]